MRRNLRSFLFLSSVLFIFPSRSTLTPLFVRVVRATASFIVFVRRYLPLFSRCSHSGPRYLFQIFHARIRVYKRALSYFPQPPLFSRSSRHRRERAHAIRRTRYVTFPVFFFGLRTLGIWYVIRSTLSRYCPLLLRKVHSSGISFRFRYHSSSPFARFSLPIPQIPSHFVTSPMGDPWKYDTLDSLPLPTLIRHAARERRTARLSDPANVAR